MLADLTLTHFRNSVSLLASYVHPGDYGGWGGVLCRVVSYRVVSCRVVSCRVVLCCVVSCPVVSRVLCVLLFMLAAVSVYNAVSPSRCTKTKEAAR